MLVSFLMIVAVAVENAIAAALVQSDRESDSAALDRWFFTAFLLVLILFNGILAVGISRGWLRQQWDDIEAMDETRLWTSDALNNSNDFNVTSAPHNNSSAMAT